jgi:hypothetical protein
MMYAVLPFGPENCCGSMLAHAPERTAVKQRKSLKSLTIVPSVD